MPSAAEPTIEIILSESRYDRQERVSWWDQSLLRHARVLVVGAGALGNELVKNLVLLGVGNIVVVDGDDIEASNLARCVFFRSEDEGMPKAMVLASRAMEVNPDVSVTGIVGDIRRFGTGVALRADVLVGAVDNREARLYCNRLAARVGRTWIDGAIEALNGVARTFSPPGTCYECTLTEDDWKAISHRQSCRLLSREQLISGMVPTTATTSSLVAAVQAQEVVKLLHHGREGVIPLDGGIVFDGLNNDCYPIKYPSNDECMSHYRYVDPIALEATSLDGPEMVMKTIAARAFPEAGDAVEEIVIDLAENHVVGWTCTQCGKTDEVRGKPAPLVAWGESLCPACQESRVPQFVTSIPGSGRYFNNTAGSLGVRCDEVLVVRRGGSERCVWLALPDPDLPSDWSSSASSEALAVSSHEQGALVP